MKDEIKQRLECLRGIMSREGVDAVIIPQTDPHQSEYVADHWQARRYLSGFTGSAGTLVVTKNRALLWTDSRYFIQAADQLSGTGIELMKDGLQTTPSVENWLAGNLVAGSVVGIDGMLFSARQAAQIEDRLIQSGIRLDNSFDPINEVWTDRPPLPKEKVFVHELKYAGESAASKLAEIKKAMAELGADAAFISPLDEIAWILNIRCKDVKYNPVATSYLYVSDRETVLLIDEVKLDADTRAYLAGIGVAVRPYAQAKQMLASVPEKRVLVEEARTSVAVMSILGEKAMSGASLVALPKSIKNNVQLTGFRSAMERDGAALVRAMMDLEEAMGKGERVTEMGVDAMLLKRRREQPLFFDESFGSIVGYAEHGAIVHYEATPETDAVLQPKGLLLIDSGAQYLDGTTDITRTIALGTPTEQEKHDFTLVMKGHIALTQAIFPAGTHGVQLDVLARQFLWAEGKGYLHGTGHGVGHFLNVHEGPQSIRLNYTPTPLMPGMVTSNEPGLYVEGTHGIRCENLVLCVPAFDTEFGSFLRFETLTLFPFDTKLIDRSIFTKAEAEWLNEYHAMVYDRLSPLLNDEERAWLKEKTQPLTL